MNNKEFFPRYTSGVYDLPNGSTLVVSRGLGTHHICLGSLYLCDCYWRSSHGLSNGRLPFRLNNRPHIPVIILRPKR